jgi:hypothetical protein
MPYTEKQLAQSNVASTTETTVYTTPAATTAIVKYITFANVTASDATISLSLVASGGSAGVTNRLYEQVIIPARSTISDETYHVLATGGFVSVKQGTASAVTTTISGLEKT